MVAEAINDFPNANDAQLSNANKMPQGFIRTHIKTCSTACVLEKNVIKACLFTNLQKIVCILVYVCPDKLIYDIYLSMALLFGFWKSPRNAEHLFSHCKKGTGMSSVKGVFDMPFLCWQCMPMGAAPRNTVLTPTFFKRDRVTWPYNALDQPLNHAVSHS